MDLLNQCGGSMQSNCTGVCSGERSPFFTRWPNSKSTFAKCRCDSTFSLIFALIFAN